MSDTLGLRFEKGEKIPHAGNTIVMQGLFGKYAVTIHSILKQRTHPEDGATLLTVRATKHLLVETGGADEPAGA